jgi:hypothetical protein
MHGLHPHARPSLLSLDRHASTSIPMLDGYGGMYATLHDAQDVRRITSILDDVFVSNYSILLVAECRL